MAKKKTVIEEPTVMEAEVVDTNDITNVTVEEIVESMEQVDTTIENNTEIEQLEEKLKEELKPLQELKEKVSEITEKQEEFNKVIAETPGKAEEIIKLQELSNIDVLWSSNYVRAISTAKYIAYQNNIELNIDENFDERKLRLFKKSRRNRQN